MEELFHDVQEETINHDIKENDLYNMKELEDILLDSDDINISYVDENYDSLNDFKNTTNNTIAPEDSEIEDNKIDDLLKHDEIEKNKKEENKKNVTTKKTKETTKKASTKKQVTKKASGSTTKKKTTKKD